jgi:hypothetical protein
MNFLTNSTGDEYGPRLPIVTDNLEGNRTADISETITYNGKATAGAITINALAYHPIMSETGERVASYWGNDENLVYTSNGEVTVTETAGSADCTCVDSSTDLEKAFESLTGTVKRFVAKVTDDSGYSLYGWIMGVTKATNLFTFQVFSSRTAETAQDWVGSLADFDATRGATLRIYRYDSSVAFGTGTTLTEEVIAPSGEYILSWKKLLDYANANLTSGQYFFDYMRALVIGKRADTTASETITYNIDANAEIEITTSGATGTLVDDAAFGVASSAVTPVGFLADETATDSVDEGDIGIARITLNRKQITADQVVDDTAFTPATSYIGVIGAQADETATDSVDEGDAGALRMTLNRRLITAGQLLDDSAFGIATDYVSPIGALVDDTSTDSVDEGDVGLPRMSATRILYTQGAIAENAADSGNPLKVGGKYNATAPTYDDGDRGDAQLDSRGNLLNSLGTKIAGEDLTNDLLGTQNKPVAVSTYAWSTDISAALEASSVTKATAGVMRYFSGRIDSTHATGTYYVQFMNAASLPADGAVTMLCAPVKVQHVTGTDSPVIVDFTMNGIYASTGIVWCLSTTEFTKTISGAFMSGTMMYK